jgi:hypothetical protein
MVTAPTDIEESQNATSMEHKLMYFKAIETVSKTYNKQLVINMAEADNEVSVSE